MSCGLVFSLAIIFATNATLFSLRNSQKSFSVMYEMK